MSPIVASGSLIIQMRICNYSKNMPWVYITYHEVVLNTGSWEMMKALVITEDLRDKELECDKGFNSIWSISVSCKEHQFILVQLFSRPHELQHARLPCPSPTPGVHSNSCPLSRWCHPAISSSVLPFSSCPQSLPASESFPMSQLFTWGGKGPEFQL